MRFAGLWAAGVVCSLLLTARSYADFVIADDLIVQGSACIGFDCVNGESFGFDTIRLKENNTRIKFDDTSSTASFPNFDWQLTANDSANGGLNKFSIEQISPTGLIPFTIEGNARTNALYVDSSGRIGIGTSTPVVNLHVRTGNTPTLRLEQDGSSGFTAQTWDVAGNETNFFIRDTTNGSKLSFRIQPNAPGNSIFVAGTSGNVGLGTASPSQRLHVRGTAGTTQALLEEASTTVASRTMLVLQNNGNPRVMFTDTSQPGTFFPWDLNPNANNDFIIDWEGLSGIVHLRIAKDTGDLFTRGTVNPPSSKHLKDEFISVDPKDVLARVNKLDISEWKYKEDKARSRHLGPVAEEFHELFGYGSTDTSISTTDESGVALAAIQGLSRELQERDATIDELRCELSEIKRMIKELDR